MTTDHAPSIAAFLLSAEGRARWQSLGLAQLLLARWPGVTREQTVRGFEIAEEMLRADARLHLADADSLRRLVKRMKPPGRPGVGANH